MESDIIIQIKFCPAHKSYCLSTDKDFATASREKQKDANFKKKHTKISVTTTISLLRFFSICQECLIEYSLDNGKTYQSVTDKTAMKFERKKVQRVAKTLHPREGEPRVVQL